MELATQTHLKTLRDLLTYRLGELRAEVHAAELAREQTGMPSVRDVGDRKDDATQQQFASMDEVQERRDLDELRQVKAALQRLDEGTYGDCADCGEPIALGRLMVQPAALCCAPCQAAREHAAERKRGQ